MANHGKCERCWWFREHLSLSFPTDNGDCYMQNDSEGHSYKEVSKYSYCPDYISRKNGDKDFGTTLEKWISANDQQKNLDF